MTIHERIEELESAPNERLSSTQKRSTIAPKAIQERIEEFESAPNND